MRIVLTSIEQNNQTLFLEFGKIFRGDPGLSAYELWLQDGNSGSLADYLRSLQQPAIDAASVLFSPDMYNITTQKPIPAGSYYTFTNPGSDYFIPNHVPVTLRKDGIMVVAKTSETEWMVCQFRGDASISFTDKSAWVKMPESTYDIAVRHGFQGTEEEYLASIEQSVVEKFPEFVLEQINERIETFGPFTARQNFSEFTGNTLEITVDSLPAIPDNIFVYVNGTLLMPETQFTLSDDTITLVEPIIEPAYVSVVWFLSNEDFSKRSPSTINDLTAISAGTRSVTLQWTAGGAYGNQGRCVKYRIYYLPVPLTSRTLPNAKFVDVTEGIGFYGDEVTASVQGLEPATIYYFAVQGYNENRGGTISSNTVYAKTTDSLVPSTLGYYINVPPENVIDFTKAYTAYEYQMGGTTFTMLGKPEFMFDGNIIEANGSLDPASGIGTHKFMSTYTGLKQTWSNRVPYVVLFDLKEVMRIDKAYVYFFKTDSLVSLLTSETGEHFREVGTFGAYADRNKWIALTTNSSNNLARYVAISFAKKAEIAEIALFGSVISAKLPTGVKYPNNIPVPRFEDFMGTNSHLTTPLTETIKFGRKIRFYSTWQWWVPYDIATNPGIRLYGDDSGDVQVYYSFTNNRVQGNLDNKFTELKQLYLDYFGATETTGYLCFKNPLQGMWHYPDGTAKSYADSSDNRMQDFSIYPQYPSNSPWAYRMIAQFVFTVAARYGRNVNIDESLIALDPTNVMRKGMDLIKYIEVENEPNRTWNADEYTYYHPEELAAMLSACYDGHQGELGPGFGVKQADPTMIFVSPGLVDQNVDYIKRMMIWFEGNRTNPDYPVYPFDVIAIHYYHTTTGGQTSSPLRKGLAPESINPVKTIAEGGTYYDVMRYITDWRDREAPGVEIWIGESGYDEHPLSRQALAEQENRSLGELKADMLMRMPLHMIAAGINAFQQYMFRNDTQLSVIIYRAVGGLYTTSGYVDNLTDTLDEYGNNYGNSDMRRYPPLASYWYVRNFIKQLQGMKFSHIIRLNKETHVEDIILEIPSEQSDLALHNICALAFVPDEDDDTLEKGPCLVLWVGTELYLESTAKIAISPTETAVLNTYFDNSDAVEFQSGFGRERTLLPTTDALGRYVEVPINGTPCILWTDNIKKKRIEAPILNARAIDANTVRLYWTDKNKDNYAVSVVSINTETHVQTEVFRDYLLSQEYDVTNLSPSVEYRFTVSFVDLTDVSQPSSEASNTVIIKTPGVLPIITNLRQTLQSYNKITIAWDYDPAALPMTEGFRIYKGTTPTGRYNILAEISREVQEFTDYGLIEDTTYYYKIVAFSTLATGVISGYVASTTLEANLDPPVVLAAKTDYFGTRISLFFDKPLNSNIIVAPNITVYDSNDGNPRILSVNSIEYNNEEYRLLLNLSQNIESSASTILIGYDGAGLLNSQYSIPVAEFSDMPVVNNFESQSLIGTKIKVKLNGNPEYNENFAPFSPPEEEPTWNLLTGRTNLSDPVTNEYIQGAIDSNENVTGITLSTCHSKKQAGTNLLLSQRNILYLTNREEAVGEFPAWSIGSGWYVHPNGPSNMLTVFFGFHNLNENSKYVLKFLSTTKLSDGDNSAIADMYVNWNPTPALRFDSGGGTVNEFTYGPIAPFTPQDTPDAQYGVVPDYNTKSILVGFLCPDLTADGITRKASYVCAAILSEVIDETLE